jgi:bacillolysin
MKKLVILFSITSLLGFTFPRNDGLKNKGTNQEYIKIDTLKGLNELEIRVSRKLNVEWNRKNSTPSFIGRKLTEAGYSKSSMKSADGKRFLSENKDLFRISNPEKELREKSIFTDELSMTHIKFEQMENGIKIFPAELVVHFNADGSIESVNGNYIPTPTINTTPVLSRSNAISIAKQKLGKYNSESELAELIIFRKNSDLKLAYVVKLPSFGYPNMKLIIDAINGEVLEKDDGIRYDGPTVGSGVGLNGTERQLQTFLDQGKYYLKDASLPMYLPPIDSLKGVIVTYDAQNDTYNDGYDKLSLVYDPNNDNNFDDNIRLRASVDAHAFSQLVYKFFKSHYNRNSFDNNGTTLENVVHYKKDFNNAFWNGSFMSYGDGDGVIFSNLAGSLDVIAHELTHGVTESTANLGTHLEPGSINESISDVFACLVDSTNWLIAEDVFTPGISGDALRNLQDPHNGKPTGSNNWQPASMDEFVISSDDEAGDWGGVHVNCGIPNKAFYNVASVIGRWKAGKIWYRALTVYLTNNSQFSDLRVACTNSAIDLYGITSLEFTAVKNGFDSVSILSFSYINLISFNDNASYLVGSKPAIHWVSTNVENVKIEYTTNGGADWNTIIESLPAYTSPYLWTIPNTPSDNCRIRISDTDDHSIADTSDNHFTIIAFAPPSQFAYGEYFIDNDPGLGNGNHFSLNQVPEQTINLDISLSGFRDGIHVVYFRVKDDKGKWSHTYSQVFIKVLNKLNRVVNIVKLNYYWDDMTGTQNSIDITVSPAPNIVKMFYASLSGLRDGIHVLHIKAVDDLGLESLLYSQDFIKKSIPNYSADRINLVEYFMDTDPGLGSGSKIDFSPADSVNLIAILPLADMTEGIHVFNVRCKSESGLWSQLYSKVFIKNKIDNNVLTNISKIGYFISNPTYLSDIKYKTDFIKGDDNQISFTLDLSSLKIDSVYNLHLFVVNNLGQQSQVYSSEFTVKDHLPVELSSVTVLIEGKFNGSKMIPDSVTVELHDTTNYGLISSSKTFLDTTGHGILKFSEGKKGTAYFLAVKHKNSIETWSNKPVSDSTYDFTSVQTSAYGNNLLLKGGKYCLYSGDVNQDGLVDLSDLILIDNDNANYVTGEVITDVNGDGLVDLSDLVLVDNNNMRYVSKIVPNVATSIKHDKTKTRKITDNK